MGFPIVHKLHHQGTHFRASSSTGLEHPTSWKSWKISAKATKCCSEATGHRIEKNNTINPKANTNQHQGGDCPKEILNVEFT